MKRKKIEINDTIFGLYGIAKRLQGLAYVISKEVSEDPGDCDPPVREGIGLVIGDLARTLQDLAVTVDEYVATTKQKLLEE